MSEVDRTPVPASIVTLPAWSVRVELVEQPRPWRIDVFSSGSRPPERAAVQLCEADLVALVPTLLRPPHAEEPFLGRARLVRDGFGLLLRLLVAPTGDEAGLVAHLQEHHRAAVLDDIARVRPDLIPAASAPEPRLCLDPVPDTGLTLDQAVELHGRLGRWLDSEGIRAAFADRVIRRRLAAG